MITITVSPKFQVVIPKEIRRELHLLPGQKLQAVRYGNRIELIPLRPLEEYRGLLEGMDCTIPKEKDRY